MLTEKQKTQIDKIIAELDTKQISWLSGYLAGIARGEESVSSVAQIALEKITLIYVSETGNSKSIATAFGAKLKEAGVKVKVKAAEQYRLQDLTKESHLILVASTHGEGDPPEIAKEFYDYVHNEDLDLSKLNYTVLALGDSNYKYYCQTGKDFDKRLADLGAKRFFDLVELDLDFADHLDGWYAAVTQALSGNTGAATQKVKLAPTKKENPKGEIILNTLLNDIGSNKETYHIEIAAEGVAYEAGDVIGIKLGDNSPRLYSIASSPNYHEDEIHLTVARVENGLCSNYLANLKEGDEISFYVKPNPHFRLPADDKDVIMIGPGTGVAPFRSFVAERDYRGASGRNWLFFGEQHARQDFLYQSEWQEFHSSGVLTNIDLAFSRDTDQKIYVQHRLKEKADEVKKWLDGGAYVYVCGDKENMAKDVTNTLAEILGKDGLAELQDSGRYLLDVY